MKKIVNNSAPVSFIKATLIIGFLFAFSCTYSQTHGLKGNVAKVEDSTFDFQDNDNTIEYTKEVSCYDTLGQLIKYTNKFKEYNVDTFIYDEKVYDYEKIGNTQIIVETFTEGDWVQKTITHEIKLDKNETIRLESIYRGNNSIEDKSYCYQIIDNDSIYREKIFKDGNFFIENYINKTSRKGYQRGNAGSATESNIQTYNRFYDDSLRIIKSMESHGKSWITHEYLPGDSLVDTYYQDSLISMKTITKNKLVVSKRYYETYLSKAYPADEIRNVITKTDSLGNWTEKKRWINEDYLSKTTRKITYCKPSYKRLFYVVSLQLNNKTTEVDKLILKKKEIKEGLCLSFKVKMVSGSEKNKFGYIMSIEDDSLTSIDKLDIGNFEILYFTMTFKSDSNYLSIYSTGTCLSEKRIEGLKQAAKKGNTHVWIEDIKVRDKKSQIPRLLPAIHLVIE